MAHYNLGRVKGTMWYVGSASGNTAINEELSGAERKPLEDDCYLNISTGDIYQYEDKGSSLEWTLKGNIKGPTGETGADGEKGKDGAPGVDAGFGEPTASATVLAAGESPTVRVTATGGNTDKVFKFEFGIPKGQDGTNGQDGAPGAAGADGKTPSLSINANGELIATFED